MASPCPSIAREICNGLRRIRGRGWYSPHMAAATRAIVDRIPLVDVMLEVRDARIPLSSEFELLRSYPFKSKRIIVLNKSDLADRSQLKEWIKHFNQQSCFSFVVNSHNKDNVKEFLNFLQARVRELKKTNNLNHTITVMLAGIPNVGKSALANSLHQIGRITAAEKGRLKHATVSPHPGGTKDINSFKIASHPNIYVLDTPGILPPEIHDIDLCSKLALTGAISDSLVGEQELARYFLSILNFSEEYKKWAKLCNYRNDKTFSEYDSQQLGGSELDIRRKRQYPTDHTQDFVVQKVRRILYQVRSDFPGQAENERDLGKLIELELAALREAFQIPDPVDLREDSITKVASKLLNLYRTGRLGHYTLDPVPQNNT